MKITASTQLSLKMEVYLFMAVAFFLSFSPQLERLRWLLEFQLRMAVCGNVMYHVHMPYMVKR